jgi:hypothetical protein
MFSTVFYITHFPCKYTIFTKEQNQFVAQYSCLFVARYPTFFGQILYSQRNKNFVAQYSCLFVARYAMFFGQILYSQRNKTFCCTILLFICSQISNVFRSDTIFTKEQNQFVAQYSCSFVARYSTFFGQMYSSSFRSHRQRCFNSELSHVVTTVVVFTIIKLLPF